MPGRRRGMAEDVLPIRDFAVRYGTRRGPRSNLNTRGTVYYQDLCYRSTDNGFITAVIETRQNCVSSTRCAGHTMAGESN